MRKELDIFAIGLDSFYSRTENVTIHAVEVIKELLIKYEEALVDLDVNIKNLIANRENFDDAMSIVYDIKVFYEDFECIYDENGDLIGSEKIYLRKPMEYIKAIKENIKEIKAEPEDYEENALEETIAILNKYENQDILDLLIELEEKLDPTIYRKKEYRECIDSLKKKLNIFNARSEKDRLQLYSSFCLEYIRKNNVLSDIESLSIRPGSIEGVIKDEYIRELDWIIEWFSKDELRKIASIDSRICFNVLNMVNACINFKNNKSIEGASNLIGMLKELKEEGKSLIL